MTTKERIEALEKRIVALETQLGYVLSRLSDLESRTPLPFIPSAPTQPIIPINPWEPFITWNDPHYVQSAQTSDKISPVFASIEVGPIAQSFCELSN